MNYAQIICMNMYFKLYKILFKSVGKFGTETRQGITEKREVHKW
jgi:hypothetical protein